MKNKPSDQLLQVAQEITFAKALASNDKNLRDKALRRLKKWLVYKSKANADFSEDGFIRLWRGLYYNVWMSDKPLVQEEVVEGISQLVHCFTKFSEAQSFIMCFFQILSEAWFGLDAHRFDKYLMFVRRFLRQSFILAEKYGWKKEQILELIESFKISFQKAPLGLLMHICEIYLEELAKISKGKLDKDILLEFIKPFGEIMSTSSDVRLIKHIEEYIYLHLLKQSDLGIKHQMKFHAWRKLGCPEGNIDVMQEVDDINFEEEDIDEFEENESSLDPRAGHVDVYLPPLKFNPSAIEQHLNEIKNNKNTTTKARKRITDLINKYKTFEHGKYPLGIHKVEVPDYDDENAIIEEAARKLIKEERHMYNKDKFNPQRKNKSKKKEKSDKGKWVVTPIKEKKLTNKRDKSRRDSDGWQISNFSVNQTEDQDNTSKKTENNSLNNKKKNPKKRKVQDTTSDTDELDKVAGNEEANNKEEKNLTNFTNNDWGDVKWDDEHETEIVIHPKKKAMPTSVSSVEKKFKQSPFLENNNSKDSSGTPKSGKKVAFVLNKNSVQDEEEYQQSLKRKSVLNVNSNATPPVGVLKSTPFSSPINPFIVTANVHDKSD